MHSTFFPILIVHAFPHSTTLEMGTEKGDASIKTTTTELRWPQTVSFLEATYPQEVQYFKMHFLQSQLDLDQHVFVIPQNVDFPYNLTDNVICAN